MAPCKKNKPMDSLEKLCLKSVLSSVIADLHLTHLLTRDLKNSLLLANYRKHSTAELLSKISQRLEILPGILNDQVRQKLLIEFYNGKGRWEFDMIGLHLLKVLLNETITTLDLGRRKLPQEALTLIAERCPNITSCSIIISDDFLVCDNDAASVDSLDLAHKRLSSKMSNRIRKSVDQSQEPSHKKRKLMASSEIYAKECGTVGIDDPFATAFKYLTHLSVKYGACNTMLRALGQNAMGLQQLQINYSYGVNDLGVKDLCLKNPDNHSQKDERLHELRVRSFHLNPCCRSLQKLEIVGTCISHFGVAFFLKYLPNLNSLGDCSTVSEALEILVGNNVKQRRSLPVIKGHLTRYKLERVKEDKVTSMKFLLLASLCPNLSELHISNPFREVDLGTSDVSLCGKSLSYLKNLKNLSIGNVCSLSVREAIVAVGAQLTSLRVLCKDLDLSVVLSTCVNLTHLTIEGSSVSARNEDLDSLCQFALKKLEVVRVKVVLSTPYVNLILSSSKVVREIEIDDLGKTDDSKITSLVSQGYFNLLNAFSVAKAPYLTVVAAQLMIDQCPKLAELRDLSGWDVKRYEFLKLESEIQDRGYQINICYDTEPERGDGYSDNDYDNLSMVSGSLPNMVDAAFRNLLPLLW